MTPYLQTARSTFGLLLALIVMIVFSGDLFLSIIAVRNRMPARVKAVSFAQLAAISVLMYIVGNVVYKQDRNVSITGFTRSAALLPSAVLAAAAILLAFLMVLSFINWMHYLKKDISAASIKEAIDDLPVGISFSDADGIPVMVNLKMHSFAQSITGGLFTSETALLEKLSGEGEEKDGRYLITCKDGRTLLFTGSNISLEKERYHQLTATDVTRLYKVTTELREKNERLLDVQKRMKAVSDLSAEMFIAQEEANAKAALHNELGQVLLMGRYFLQNPDNTDAEMVLLTTKQMNAFLLREADEPYTRAEDAVRQAVRMAKSIGVSVEIEGSVPQNSNVRDILAQAIQECAANTVKHAGGDSLYVEIERPGGDLPEAETPGSSGNPPDTVTIRITNSGRPPAEEIHESGGLLSLRRAVEGSGGQMEIACIPAFELNLRFADKNGMNG